MVLVLGFSAWYAFPAFHLIMENRRWECGVYSATDAEGAEDWVAPTCVFQEREHCWFDFNTDGELQSWHGNAGFPNACNKLIAEKK